MARLQRRGFQQGERVRVQGTAEQRVLTSLRLGARALAIFLATLPDGTTPQAARHRMQRNLHRGRRRSVAASELEA
jgi:hypothetical protein